MDESRHSANAQHLQPVHLLPAAPLHEDASTLRVYLLGGFTITLGERSLDVSAWRLRKAQSLVKLLVLAPGHRLHRERVLDLLWPDLELEAAANNLHYTMHTARTTLASLWEPTIPTILPSGSHPRPRTGALLRLRQQIVALEPPAPLWVDVDAFDDAAGSARLGTDPLRYEAAINLYGGDLLPDDRYEDWATNRREALGANYQALLLAVAQLYASQDNLAAAIDAFQRVLASEPAHEEAHMRLMRLYALSGQRHHAMRQYERLREALQRELEILPSQESRSLYDDILAGRLIPESSATMERPAPSEAPLALGQSPAAATPDDTAQVSPDVDASPTLNAASALVGRQDVLAQLRDVWAAAATEPQALLIVGEAGIGKSRIAEEALAWAAGHHHRDGKPIIKTAMARCYLAEGELPFGVVTTWLRSRSLWPGALALDEVWQVEVARVVPDLLVERPTLRLPPPLPERMQRLRLFDALARAVTQSGHPLLLVIDDLQWCERETLEWLRYLLRQTMRAPLLIIGTVRAEEVTPDHPLVALTADLRHTQQLTEVALEPLDSAETTALGAQVAGQALDTTQAERLYAETEGSPLFVVELLRAGLLNKSLAPATADRIDRIAENATGRLPLTLQAVMSRRLRQLSPGARDLAGMAAVVGREFSADLLIEASHTGGYTEESIIQALEELQQRRIVREQGAGGYDFSHDKLRETAYTELSAIRRRTLHRRVARALEVISADAPDEVLAQLAMHYERGGETKRACYALERAGNLAIQRGALLIARDYLQRVVALAPVDDQMRCYEELGDSYGMFGGFDHYRTAMERWRGQDAGVQDPLVGARLLRKTLFAWLRFSVIPESRRDELAAMSAEAQTLAKRAGDEGELQRVRVAAQGLLWRKEMNDLPVTVDYIRSGQAEFLAIVDSFAARGNWEDFDAALDVFTTCFQEIGAFNEAMEIAHRRLRASNLPPHQQGEVIGMVAMTNFMMGNFHGCMDTLRAAWQASRPDVPLLISNSLYGTYSALYIGAWDELDTFVAIDERVWNESGHILTDALRGYWALLHVGFARGDQSAVDRATAKLEQWLAIAPNCDSTSPALLAAYLADNPAPLGSIYPSDKWTPVSLCLALMFFNERGIPSPPGIFDRAVKRMPLYADYCQMCIRMAEVVATADSASLAAIIEEFEAHELIPHAARMRIVLAQRTGERVHLERARPVLERLGDRQFLRRLEAVAATLP